MMTHLLPTGLIIGLFATLIMDATAQLLARFQIVSNMPFFRLGRIAAGWLRGRFVYNSFAEVQAVRGETLLGLLTHYLIGAILPLFLVLIMPLLQTPGNQMVVPVIYGLLTICLSWFLLMPSVGFGVMGFKTPPEMRFVRTSIINHFVYGVGLTIGFACDRWLFGIGV